MLARARGGWHHRAMMKRIGSAGLALALGVALAGCATARQDNGHGDGPQARFMARIAALCGKAFAGRVVTTDPADSDMIGKALVMHVAKCGADEVRIPFHVGDDRSRTWVITRTARGLRLKHDHRHQDGGPDAVTMYGGDTAGAGTATRQEFPVDAESVAMFRANGLARSATNVWAIEADERLFVYELKRPAGENARHFRVEFDLTTPVAVPPKAWGAE